MDANEFIEWHSDNDNPALAERSTRDTDEVEGQGPPLAPGLQHLMRYGSGSLEHW
jgi:hypothetical protein